MRRNSVPFILIFLLGATPAFAAANATFAVSMNAIVHYDRRFDTKPLGSECPGITREEDDFGVSTLYPRLVVPLTGSASTTYNLTAIDALIGFASPTSHAPLSTSSKAVVDLNCIGGGEGTSQCTGDLVSDDSDPPHLLSRAGLANKVLHLHVEATRMIRIKDSTGTAPPLGCATTYDGNPALDPAYQDFMPDMLSANVDVPLSSLRAVRQGGTFTIDISLAKNAPKRPPLNCSNRIVVCSQHFDWSGTLVFRRTR